MTAATQTLPPSRSNESGRRILAVTKLHFVNRFQILYLPLIILGTIFLLNLAVWWIIMAASAGKVSGAQLGYSGAVSYIYVYGIVIAGQAISRTFPLSLGFGVTRRDFYLGSVLAFIALSFGFAVILTIMSLIEIATGGWGLGGRMFAPLWFTDGSWLLRFVMYFCAFLFLLFVGTAGAAFYVRWGGNGPHCLLRHHPGAGGRHVRLRHAQPPVGRHRYLADPVGSGGNHRLAARARGDLRSRRILRTTAGDAEELTSARAQAG